MKKIFIIVGLFLFFPINAFASECTQEMIDSYLPQANQVSLTYQVTTNPDTYMIYVNGLTSGISFNGINGVSFDNGFYAYAQAGETFTISIRISDGSVCALQEIKKTSVKLPSAPAGNEPDSDPVENNEEKTEEEPKETSNDRPKTETSPTTKPPVTNNPEIIDNSENEELEYIEEEEEVILEDQVEDIDLDKDSEKQKIAEEISDVKKIPYLILIPIISIIGSITFIIYKRRKLE
ncbi:MAG: hypothetical protein GX758_05125 [Tenericutes bacterium]|nr:hypothetical protein [Mycoplasmatota bacterium]